MISGVEKDVPHSTENVIQYATRQASATVTEPLTVTSVPLMPTVTTTESVSATTTGPERIVASTPVSVTKSVKSATALRTATVLSALPMLVVMTKAPVAVYQTGQALIVPPSTRPTVAPNATDHVLDLLTAIAMFALSTQPATHTTRTVNVTTTGVMKTVHCTPECALSYV